MSDLINLAEIEAPDCSKCLEETKTVCGKTFDVEGPGKVGTIYDCNNMRCRRKKNDIELFRLRRAGLTCN